jgi:hypothetical protein
MRFISLHLIWILSLVIVLSACKKDYDELPDSLIGIDPVKEKTTLNKLLMLEGSFRENGIFPRKTGITPLGATSISNYPDTVSAGVGEPIIIQFNLSNPIPPAFAKLCSLYIKVSGSQGYWSAKWDTANTRGNEFAFQLRVPFGLVRAKSFKLTYAIDIRAFRAIPGSNDTIFITDTVNTFVNLVPGANCGDTLRLPSMRLSIRKWNLGDRKGRVKVGFLSTFSNANAPDRFDIKYNNRYVVSTAPTLLPPSQIPRCKGTGVDNEEGFIFTNGWMQKPEWEFDYDPAISREVIVYGLGNCYIGSAATGGYSITLSCPQ